MGFVVEPQEAKESTCKCYRTGKGKDPESLMCFSDGVMGTLSDAQDKKYCKDKVVRPPSEEFSEHIKKFKQMGKIMDVCAEEKVKDFSKCVAREAEKME